MCEYVKPYAFYIRNKLEHHEIDANRQEVEKLLLAIHDPLLKLFEAHLKKLNQLQTLQAKQVWNNIIRDAVLTRYDSIQSMRPTDGAKITARRRVADINTPIRWTITMTDRIDQFIIEVLATTLPLQG